MSGILTWKRVAERVRESERVRERGRRGTPMSLTLAPGSWMHSPDKLQRYLAHKTTGVPRSQDHRGTSLIRPQGYLALKKPQGAWTRQDSHFQHSRAPFIARLGGWAFLLWARYPCTACSSRAPVSARPTNPPQEHVFTVRTCSHLAGAAKPYNPSVWWARYPCTAFPPSAPFSTRLFPKEREPHPEDAARAVLSRPTVGA
jgi:hypothetical protein